MHQSVKGNKLFHGLQPKHLHWMLELFCMKLFSCIKTSHISESTRKWVKYYNYNVIIRIRNVNKIFQLTKNRNIIIITITDNSTLAKLTYMSFFTSASSNLRPINRLVAYKVFWALVTACRFAGIPARRPPSRHNKHYTLFIWIQLQGHLPFVKAITDGVVLDPSAFSMTLGFFPYITATQECVVPKSIPITAPFTPSDLNRFWTFNWFR